MDGNNTSFINDPEAFLRKKILSFNHMNRNSNVGKFSDINGEQIVEFDFVPIKGNAKAVEVNVLGPVGTYGQTDRRGKPVVGHFLHWNGQTYKKGCETFGSLNLAACHANFVLTAPFTGCRFVVVRLENGAGLRVYHEPTEDDGDCVYPGEVIIRFGPDYKSKFNVSGNGVLVRTKGGWKAIVSERTFGRKLTVSTQEFA